MKRQLIFKFENEKYVIKESDDIIFSIDGKDLKFISLDFYNGVFKDKTAAIELFNDINNDTLKKGDYIFKWLSDIITAIQFELNEPELEEISIIVPNKKVPLFELSACAGNGFYSSGPSNIDYKIDSPFSEADYAVKISGKSMEPTIEEQTIVFVKDTKELIDGDIGIFVVNGEVMCKRYHINNNNKWLSPDNKSADYFDIYCNEDVECLIQGKVLLESKL